MLGSCTRAGTIVEDAFRSGFGVETTTPVGVAPGVPMRGETAALLVSDDDRFVLAAKGDGEATVVVLAAARGAARLGVSCRRSASSIYVLSARPSRARRRPRRCRP